MTHGLTMLEVQLAQACALTRLNDHAVRHGGVALPLEDPRVLAGRLERAAAQARTALLLGAESADGLLDEVAALAGAVRLSRARVEAESPFTGGEAA